MVDKRDGLEEKKRKEGGSIEIRQNEWMCTAQAQGVVAAQQTGCR